MSIRIYIAGPLFCKAELDYNRKLADELEANGFDVTLPQELEHDTEELVRTDPDNAYQRIFDADVEALMDCNVLVMVMDGRVPDEGACVELGIAYNAGMECFGIKTDVRTSEYGMDNFMITGALKGRVSRSVGELCQMIYSAPGIFKD